MKSAPKKKNSKLFWSITITVTAFLAAITVATVMAIQLVHSVFRWEFPSRLEVGKTIHHQGTTHIMGPAGISRTFTVYALPKDVSNRIKEEGTMFLNSSPLTLAQKSKTRYPDGQDTYKDIGIVRWKPFIKWEAASEVLKREPPDNTRKYRNAAHSFLTRFYGFHPTERQFVESIPADILESFQDGMATPDSYCVRGGYGGRRLIIVPSQQLAFYLYRG